MNNRTLLENCVSLSYRFIFLALISFVLSGCILNITAGAGGSVHQGSESGTTCDAGCTIDTADASGDAYFAVADEGYAFSHWDGASGMCAEEQGFLCTIDELSTGNPLFDELELELTAIFVQIYTLTGTLSFSVPAAVSELEVSSKPRLQQSREKLELSDWSGAKIEIWDSKGEPFFYERDPEDDNKYVKTSEVQVDSDGNFSVKLDASEQYFIRVIIGNVVMHGYINPSSTDKAIEINPQTTAEFLVLDAYIIKQLATEGVAIEETPEEIGAIINAMDSGTILSIAQSMFDTSFTYADWERTREHALEHALSLQSVGPATVQYDDAAEDASDCASGEAVADSSVDIESVTINPGVDVIDVLVTLGLSPTASFEDYSFALILAFFDYFAIIEVHAGVWQHGQLDSNGDVIPGTESDVAFTDEAVIFSVPTDYAVSTGGAVEVSAYHTGNEDGSVSCDNIVINDVQI